VAAVGGAPVVADWVGVDVGQSQGRSGTANRSSHEKLGPTNHILLCNIVTASLRKLSGGLMQTLCVLLIHLLYDTGVT
jgi:hypothetical protein